MRPHCVVTVDGSWVFVPWALRVSSYSSERLSWRIQKHPWFYTVATEYSSCSSSHFYLHLFATLWELRTRRCVFLISVLSPQVSLYSSNLAGQGALTVPGLFDAIGLCTVEELVAACETKFKRRCPTLPQFSFLLSPSCILFATASELKFGEPFNFWAWNGWWSKIWFHSSRVKWPVVNIVCEFGYLVSIDIFWFGFWGPAWFMSIPPVKSNSVGSGYVSHCWTYAFENHCNHCFDIRNNVKHRTKLRRLRIRWDIIDIAQFKIVVLNWCLGLVMGVLVWWGVTRQVPSTLPVDFFNCVRGTRMEHFNNQIP